MANIYEMWLTLFNFAEEMANKVDLLEQPLLRVRMEFDLAVVETFLTYKGEID